MGYLFLVLAIVGEIIGTNLLKISAGFSRLIPTLGSLVSYGLSFYFLSLTLKSVDLNIAYALWSGLGIVLTSLIAVIYWKEPINFSSILGIGLILIGVVVLNLHGASH
ncbi:DMT family transporter [Sporolactobacillus terrae]|uniref:DMT family transporter n=1 Tax=Sporolactobacillus terrae TaxID=269673 RepID=UPI00111A8C42|nr:multidrug efflux SMR transporter [Sporolactobacillus terrae]